ncbi:MAG: MlaD family protein [bacterium]|nr:MlaD family protein [bacterium]
MERSYRYEVSVGLFVIAAAVVLAALSLRISRARVRDGVEADFLFSHACGLVKDSPVSVAGVEVGFVKAIRLDAGRARVTARVRSDAALGRDIRATIRQKSLLGEPYLEIVPGDPGSPPLRDGDLVTATVTPVQVDQAFSWLGRLLEGIEPEEAARLVRALAEDPAAVRRIVARADDLLGRLAALDAAEIRDFIRDLRIRARLF